MSNLPVPVTRAIGNSRLFLKKHGPDILFGAGLVGMAGAVYLAVQAGKGHDDVAYENERIMEDATTTPVENEQAYKQVVGRAWISTMGNWTKLYGPAAGAFLLSAGSLTLGHMKTKERAAAAMAAYAFLDKGFKDYRSRVVDKFGEETDAELRYGEADKEAYRELAENGRTKKRAPVGAVGPYAVYFDEYNINWRSEASMNAFFLKANQDQLNNRLRAYGHVFLNEVFDELNIERIPEGQLVGWVYDADDPDCFIDLGLYDPINMEFHEGLDPVCIINPNVQGTIYDLL